MSGIFNIYSESENHNTLSLNKGKEKSQALTFSKLKTNQSSSSHSAKIFAQPQFQSKPKGLSIRSKSDLNVSISSNCGLNKKFSKDCINLDVGNKQNLTKKLSPIKLKTPKSKTFENVTPKKLPLKISSPIMQNVTEEFVFKKPVSPKTMKKLPEPECLSYCFDPIKVMNEEIECIFKEDLMFLKSACKNDDSIISKDDEGFVSDLEVDSFCDSLDFSLSFKDMDVELPDISDCED